MSEKQYNPLPWLVSNWPILAFLVAAGAGYTQITFKLTALEERQKEQLEVFEKMEAQILKLQDTQAELKSKVGILEYAGRQQGLAFSSRRAPTSQNVK